MCGRYSLINNKSSTLKKRFKLKTAPKISSRYNIAPNQNAPILLNEKPDEIKLAHWGLVPEWSLGRKAYNLINARAENLKEKRTYSSLIDRKRCLILADGFYEWKKEQNKKSPFRFSFENEEVFGFAGLWDVHAEDKDTCCFTIITVSANDIVHSIHPRMPAIIDRKFESLWLSDTSFSNVENLLKPLDSGNLIKKRVSSSLNSPAIDTAEVLNEEFSG